MVHTMTRYVQKVSKGIMWREDAFEEPCDCGIPRDHVWPPARDEPGRTAKELRALAYDMPYRGESRKLDILKWLVQYHPERLG